MPIQLKGCFYVWVYFGRNCWLGTLKLLCGHPIPKSATKEVRKRLFEVPSYQVWSSGKQLMAFAQLVQLATGATSWNQLSWVQIMRGAKPNSTEWAIDSVPGWAWLLGLVNVAILKAKVCEHSILFPFGSPKSKQFFSCFAFSGELTCWRNIGHCEERLGQRLIG